MFRIIALTNMSAREKTNGHFDKETFMDFTNLRTLIPLSLLAILPVGLMAEDSAHFKIPFDFTVGKQQFYAGDYLIGRSAPSVLSIRTGSGYNVLMTLANSSSPSRVPGIVSLTFDRVDDRYFLSKWAGNDWGLELAPPAAEKELIARKATRKPVTVVASSRSNQH
jgi:hypothetical protein